MRTGQRELANRRVQHFTLAKFEDSGSLTQQCQLAEIDEGERTLRLGRDSVGF